MHEESITRSLLRQVDELAQQHNALAVEDIEVEAGELSGIEPLLLQSAFERMKESTLLCGNATLSISKIGLEAECLSCQAVVPIRDFHFVCTECHSTGLRILRGDSLRLLTLRMQLGTPVQVVETAGNR